MAENLITDRESLKAWLDTRSQADCIAIAQRVALRVFPLARVKGSAARKRTKTLLLRCLLTSGVARNDPSDIVKKAAAAAAAAAAAYAADADAAAAAAAAAYAYAYAADAYAADAYAADAYAAADYKFSQAFWAEVTFDVAQLTLGVDASLLPLWSQDPPQVIADREVEMLEVLAIETGNRNSFWHRWWFATKRGAPMNWDLQREIALIDNAVWEEGPKAVMVAIGEIELSYAIAATPNGERISLNPTTQLFRSDPVSHISNNHLADVVDTLQDATRVFDDAGGPNGPYGDLNAEIGLIKDACERYQLRPLMLLRVCRRVVERVQIKEATGSCPKNDPLVADFLSLVGAAAADLYAFDSDVQEAERSRLASKFGPAFGDASAAIVEAADQSATISEGVLKDELPEDARTAASTEPSAARDIAAYQTRSRLLRIYAGVEKGVDHVERYSGVYGLIATILLALLV